MDNIRFSPMRCPNLPERIPRTSPPQPHQPRLMTSRALLMILHYWRRREELSARVQQQDFFYLLLLYERTTPILYLYPYIPLPPPPPTLHIFFFGPPLVPNNYSQIEIHQSHGPWKVRHLEITSFLFYSDFSLRYFSDIEVISSDKVSCSKILISLKSK